MGNPVENFNDQGKYNRFSIVPKESSWESPSDKGLPNEKVNLSNLIRFEELFIDKVIREN